MSPRDRDDRNTIRPPAAVREQIARPLKKPRAATPVEFEAFEPTGVHPTPPPVPVREETAEERQQRQTAEIKNINIEQSSELARLRATQDEIVKLFLGAKQAELEAKKVELEDQAKRRAAWLAFWIKFGGVVVIAAAALAGLIKLSGCGD